MNAPFTIQVILKSQYGNDRIFPHCEKAHAFAAIAGNKTLSKENIECIKALGFCVSVVSLVKSL